MPGAVHGASRGLFDENVESMKYGSGLLWVVFSRAARVNVDRKPTTCFHANVVCTWVYEVPRITRDGYGNWNCPAHELLRKNARGKKEAAAVTFEPKKPRLKLMDSIIRTATACLRPLGASLSCCRARLAFVHVYPSQHPYV